MKNILLFILIFSSSPAIFAQKYKELIVVRAIIIDGDTVPLIDLPQVRIYTERIFKNQREKTKYTKLMRDIKKVYPYANQEQHRKSHDSRNNGRFSVRQFCNQYR